MESFSFVAPFAYLLGVADAWERQKPHVTLGIARCLGMVAGSLAWSLATRTFRLESFRDSADLINHLSEAR